MLVPHELSSLGLDHKTVSRHRERLVAALARGDRPLFRIVDTCRIDNGGLLGEGALALAKTAATVPGPAMPATGIAAFVPAAGAASRYSKPLANLIDALERGDGESLVEMVRALAAEGASSWPLPTRVKALLAKPEAAAKLDDATRAGLLFDLSLPKALLPCVGEGLTFLEMKQEEHAALKGLAGEVYVTPPGLAERFAAACKNAHFLEQGPALSTLRFEKNGEPAREPDGRASLVPAGHGALASLFPAVREALPAAHSLFIRNIDNVMGTSAAAVRASSDFLELYQLAYAATFGIRAALREGSAKKAASLAGSLAALEAALPDGPDPERTRQVTSLLEGVPSVEERALWRIQLRLFHAPLPAEKPSLKALASLYERPLNVLGQVPNTARDVGGTPCFVVTQRGVEKVCIEVPHVSEADKDAYLANPERATHFNPVFVLAEITADPAYYAEKNEDFWLLAEKSWRGRTVYYHETVLFELLGNGAVANALFVEVPRLVFNPHKTLKDAVNRSVRDWR